MVLGAGFTRLVSIAYTREARGVDTVDLGYGERGESDTGCMEGAAVERERGATLVVGHHMSTQGDNGRKGVVTLFTQILSIGGRGACKIDIGSFIT